MSGVKRNYDVIISGAGIYGLLISKQLSLAGINVLILEKNDKNFLNNSQLNSGVLHSGIYNHPDSLKRKHCMKGNKLLQQYLTEKKIPFNMCGKLIVPYFKSEIAKIKQIHSNFLSHSQLISFNQAREHCNISNHLSSNDKCVLYIPNAGFSNPKSVYQSILSDINEINTQNIAKNGSPAIQIDYNCSCNQAYETGKNIRIESDKGEVYESLHFINCSGNSSLEIAKKFGICEEYDEILLNANYFFTDTIKHLSADNKSDILIYPAPLNFSLGVHFTPYENGTLIGPSVDLNLKTIAEAISRFRISPYLFQMATDFINSNYILGTLKLSKIYPNLSWKILKSQTFKKSLVRAPLINKKTGRFESDFIIKEKSSSTHLLNIQSPGWTSSFSLASDVTESVLNKLSKPNL